ncbi:MAG TPA: VWA domain-containing protein [Vicinamibacterales bacterium]|jgi:hypothetical protein
MPEELVANLIVFARTLRASGVAVRPSGVPDALSALGVVGVENRGDVRDALRAVLLSRHDDYAAFDSVFNQFWRAWRESSDALPQPMHVPERGRSRVRITAPGIATADATDRQPSSSDEPVGVRTYSADETWRRKDFATFTPEDFIKASAAMSMLTWNPGVRVTRRWIPGAGRHIDLRRLLRANASRSHEWLIIPKRTRRTEPRPLVLICDVSGSMEPYARMLLLFAHAIAGDTRRVEVFVFSTRLTRVTRQFATRRPEVAMSAVREAVGDWSGGTRIGAAIRSFNVHWARRVLRGNPVLLLISDGWDLGDPQELAREMARLQRSVRRLIWLNPLLGSPGYEPLARGMHAALPFVDDFLPVHNMVSLEALAGRLNELKN